MMVEHDENVESILQRQEDAMTLLDRLRTEEPIVTRESDAAGGGRRQFRRWPTPPGVTLELHDGERWHVIESLDMGVGGTRVKTLPSWVDGPVPARLRSGQGATVLVLSDIMWRDSNGECGLSFDFLDREEHELWATSLIDALLAQYSLV